jgi:ribosomal protein S27E
VNILDEASTVVSVKCPDCDLAVPVTVQVIVGVCDCGRHQAIFTEPNLLDVEAHSLTHVEADA